MSEKMNKYSLRLEIVSASFDLNRTDRIARAELCILFQGQLSYSSKVTIDASNIMVFNNKFEFDLTSENDLNSLMNDDYGDNTAISQTPIVISLNECPSITPLYEDFEIIPVSKGFTKNIKALSIIDMRLASIYSTSYISVELIPTDNDIMDSKLSGSGALYLKLSIVDNYSNGALVPPLPVTDTEMLLNQINIYQKSISKTCHDNYQRARLWLTALRQSHPWITQSHEIKLLTQDETGQNRFVNSFLGPVYCSRDIPNPRTAARYLSVAVAV